MSYTRWKLLAILSDLCTLIAVTYPLCLLIMRFMVTHFPRIESLATGLGISPTYCAAYLHVLTHISIVDVFAINVGICVLGVGCLEGYRATVGRRREGMGAMDSCAAGNKRRAGARRSVLGHHHETIHGPKEGRAYHKDFARLALLDIIEVSLATATTERRGGIVLGAGTAHVP
ncbi:hypothetical protein C8F04DRAFT_1392869 [Mycena alexandri]|uniref:Uncharacterized protein n=1 Tax=Mycena alexandri TaxID=1745969 RepID=A0AAD6T4R7_9AGAR|nr:hypothetical protein C8F04DRAFT_1392869 [Mycena alexandri]